MARSFAPNGRRGRILSYLQRNPCKDLTAVDIAREVDYPAREIGQLLSKDIEGVVVTRAKGYHNLYRFDPPTAVL